MNGAKPYRGSELPPGVFSTLMTWGVLANTAGHIGVIDDNAYNSFIRNKTGLDVNAARSYRFVLKMCCKGVEGVSGWWHVAPDDIGIDSSGIDSSRSNEPVIGTLLPKRSGSLEE